MIKSKVVRWIKANYALVVAFGASGLLGYQFLVVQGAAGTNFAYDAGQYLWLAMEYGQAFLGRSDFPLLPLRTSAYPLFLLFVINLGGAFSLAPAESVFVIQLLVWWLAISSVHFGFGRFLSVTGSSSDNPSKQVRAKFGRDIMVIVLGLNIFISPYLSVGLTDSVYTSIALMFVVWVTLYASKVEVGAGLFTGLFLASLALVIRPAAVWLFIIMAVVVALFALSRARVWSSGRFSPNRVGKAFLVFTFGSSPVVIQSVIQYLKFGVFSPLPAADLGGSQVLWGIANVKYATWLGEGPAGNFYPSSELIGPQSPEGISWYWENLVPALQLLTFKLVAAFDFDFLVPYPEVQRGDSWFFGSISLLIFVLGLTATVTHLYRPFDFIGPRWLPLLIFLSWGSINLLSALELRFSLPIVLYFSIISIPLVQRVLHSKPRTQLIYGVFLLVIFAMAWSVAAEVRSYSILNQNYPNPSVE
jgi:hypothetical protein